VIVKRVSRTSEVLAVVLACGFLLGAGVNRLMLPKPKAAGPYHVRIAAAAKAIPLRVGDWVGTDIEQPEVVDEQLHPNVLISRSYTNISTGHRVSLLLVQCPDVRYLVPHYPPVCYPGRGLSLRRSEAVDWSADGLKVAGTRYEFESNTFHSPKLTVVDNFIVLPDGRICRNMDGVEREIGLANRYFGAAQVQVVFDAGTREGERSKITEQFIVMFKPLIDEIRSGVVR
jgi:hypothetical protein